MVQTPIIHALAISVYCAHDRALVEDILEPIIAEKIYLLFLSELPKIFTYYSYFIPIAPPIIPFLFYCADDNITMQE